MSSVLNMLGLHDDGGIKLEFVLPIAVVLVAFVFLLKLSVRKPEPAKKSQAVKKQKVTTNKQKDEKPNSDRKEKVIKEKKPSPSPVKPVDTTDDKVKSKPNKKQQSGSEKSPKKNAQTKKQQVAANNDQKNTTSKNNQSNKKQVETFISKEEEGEWQMVTTKKQKQTKQDVPLEATTPTKSKKKLEKTPEKNKNATKTKEIKAANEKNESPSTVLNGEVTPPEIKEVGQTKSLGNDQEIRGANTTTVAPVQQEHSVSEKHDSGKAAVTANSEDKTLQDQNEAHANVAFDELGDHDWKDTKPQRKNRRKALRE